MTRQSRGQRGGHRVPRFLSKISPSSSLRFYVDQTPQDEGQCSEASGPLQGKPGGPRVGVGAVDTPSGFHSPPPPPPRVTSAQLGFKSASQILLWGNAGSSQSDGFSCNILPFYRPVFPLPSTGGGSLANLRDRERDCRTGVGELPARRAAP